LTSKQQIFYIFGISKQFEIRKSTISIYSAISIFDLHMRIFNLQGLGLPTNLKKKIKYAEIDFTSYHIFLRLRNVKKINLKLSHTKKNPAYCIECTMCCSECGLTLKHDLICDIFLQFNDALSIITSLEVLYIIIIMCSKVFWKSCLCD
jgi:hypothetical protein